MITVIVSYQVKPEFVAENKKNIQLFLDDFKKLDKSGFRYHVYTKEDGVTFVHYSTYKDENIQLAILNVPSFKDFQKKRDESGLNGSHKVEVLSYVGSSAEMF